MHVQAVSGRGIRPLIPSSALTRRIGVEPNVGEGGVGGHLGPPLQYQNPKQLLFHRSRLIIQRPHSGMRRNDANFERARAAREPPLRKRKFCLPPGYPTHFPAIAVLREIPPCDIVRAARGSDFPHPQEWNGKERGFLMGISGAAGMETAIAAYSAGTTHSSSKGHGQLASCPYKNVCLFSSLGLDSTLGRGVAWNGFDVAAIMKVMIFPAKYR